MGPHSQPVSFRDARPIAQSLDPGKSAASTDASLVEREFSEYMREDKFLPGWWIVPLFTFGLVLLLLAVVF